MSVLYLFIQLYPLFGIALAVLCLDLVKVYRRRGNAVWVGFAIFGVLFGISIILWIYFRGDINSEKWFNSVAGFFQ